MSKLRIGLIMNILLFGEFSGFMNCLKSGLMSLGHNVVLVSGGDGYKNYPSDIRWDKCSSFIQKSILNTPKLCGLLYLDNLWKNRAMLKNYDVVLLISPYIFNSRLKLNEAVINYIINNNGKTFVSGAGMWKKSFDYWYHSKTKYHSYCEGLLLDYPNCRYLYNDAMGEWEDKLLSKIDGLIPIWYEYAEPFRNSTCLKQTIRIPIDVSQHLYQPNRLIQEKVVFYHGVSRKCKGERFIKPAFEKMQKVYGKQAEFICAERLPFDRYMQVINSANVIVDDANSFSVAMNGLFSMAKGKIVMGGAEPIADKELGIVDNPVYNVMPDVDQICSVIEMIMTQKDNLEAIGFAGRKYVEKYHNHIDIAQQYIEVFERG